MITIETALKKLGFSEKEAKVYSATLELGSGSVQEIAKKAEIKRPTVYVILGQLKERGYISEKPAARGSIFIAENPEHFVDNVEQQKRALDEALPFMRAMYGAEKEKPQVRVYEGIKGMEKIYYETVWKSKTEILFFSSIKKINERMPDLLDKWLYDMSHERTFQNKTKELINPDEEDIEYGLKAEKACKGQNVRVLPKNASFQFVGTDNAIFEDKIMMVSFEGKLFTTVIQSKVLANTMRALYELAWQSAIPVEEYVKKHPEVLKNKKTG